MAGRFWWLVVQYHDDPVALACFRANTTDKAKQYAEEAGYQVLSIWASDVAAQAELRRVQLARARVQE